MNPRQFYCLRGFIFKLMTLTFHMAFRGVVYHFYCDRAGLSMYIKAWNSICIVPDISTPSGACCPRIYRNGRHGASSDNEGTGGAGVSADCNLFTSDIIDQYEEERVFAKLQKYSCGSGDI